MKKIKQLFTFVIICVLFISCDTKFSSNGVVIDQNTRQPVVGVKISIKDRDSTYTDNFGKYRIDKFIYGWAGDFEILLEKDGYKTKHVNFNRGKLQSANTTIELEKSEGKSVCAVDRKYVKTMFYFNKYVLSLLNLLTFLFVAIKKKVDYRFVWIMGILLLNPTFFISFTDLSLVKFNFLNGPVYLTHFHMYPYSLKFIIPLTSILFWIIYLVKRDKIFYEIETEKNAW